ncbi:MAG: BrnA antitoxin family protein [Treponema sp.]|nr:BrnA antitoxin family protein [Treponema sp.]
MGITRSTVMVGQKPPKEVIREVRRAARKPINFSEDCPPSSPEALKEFAHLAAARNRLKKKKSVTIRIAPDVLECYKTMGDGYTGIMADVLKYAADNPDILANATR